MDYYLMITLVVFLILAWLGCIISRIGVDSLFNDFSRDAACALAYVLIFVITLIGCSSYSSLYELFSAFCGGIPYVNDIIDYGSFIALWRQAPLLGARGFLDMVLISFIIKILLRMFYIFPENLGFFKFFSFLFRKARFYQIFSAVIISLVTTLIIMNWVIRPSDAYQLACTILGGFISFVTAMSIPASFVKLFKKFFASGGVSLFVIYMLLKVFNGKIIKEFRSAVFGAGLITVGLIAVEHHFGSLASGLSIFSMILNAALPCLIMIIAIWIMTSSVLQILK